ncbi:hypothetical protein ABZ079_30875 [Streptomyces sp. NPDC006314]|uniref:hypothetical protein n=1 Tax=Streptomyces sp. NPDC006314 TaxID=3154475 RepID=UPI0033A33490
MQRFFLGSKRRLATGLSTAAVLSLLAPLTSAQADEGQHAQQVEGYVQPIGSEPLTLSELRGPDGMRRLHALQDKESSLPLLPRETVGQARSFAPLSQKASAQSEGIDRGKSSAVSLPEPSHGMELQECIKHLGSSKFYVKSRYAVCSGQTFSQVWIRDGDPVGTSQFDVIVIGTIPKDSRTMTATYYYTGFTAAGINAARQLGITTKASIPKTWPSRVKIIKGGDKLPKTKTWQELLDGRTIHQTINVPSGQTGTSGPKTRLIASVYQPSISLKDPPGWTSPGLGGDIFMLPPRWDQATYLPKSAGAAVFSVLTSLRYHTASSAPEHEVASHIKKAYTKPGQTRPPFSRKKLPGKTSSAPLTRLYWDGKRREKIRNRAVYNCTKYWGRDYSKGGKRECDEFPFASTYEGAAGSVYNPRQDPLNFSVMPVSKKSNGAAGNLLLQYYKLNRIIDGPDDGFMVNISS